MSLRQIVKQVFGQHVLAGNSPQVVVGMGPPAADDAAESPILQGADQNLFGEPAAVRHVMVAPLQR